MRLVDRPRAGAALAWAAPHLLAALAGSFAFDIWDPVASLAPTILAGPTGLVAFVWALHRRGMRPPRLALGFLAGLLAVLPQLAADLICTVAIVGAQERITERWVRRSLEEDGCETGDIPRGFIHWGTSPAFREVSATGDCSVDYYAPTSGMRCSIRANQPLICWD